MKCAETDNIGRVIHAAINATETGKPEETLLILIEATAAFVEFSIQNVGASETLREQVPKMVSEFYAVYRKRAN